MFANACAPNANSRDAALPKVMRVGVLPDQSRESVEIRYQPLIEFLAEETGLKLELRIPDDYQSLVSEFHAGKVDLAHFGGVTFVRAEQEAEARPLVLRDVDLAFTTDFLAAVSDEREQLADFEGAVFAFGSRLSTSSHLMPRQFMGSQSITPEAFFSEVRYSGGHEATARWVQNGTVELGAANSIVVEAMFVDGRLSRDKVRVVARSDPYCDYVWATQSGMDETLRTRIRDGFLALDISNSKHAAILKRLGARAFLPAKSNDHDSIRMALDEYGSHLDLPPG